VGLEHLFDSYNRALVAEIRAWGEELAGPRLDTIFIGGGTPSRVPAAHMKAALDAVRDSFDVAPDAEITLEANPQSAEATRMSSWLEAGVNRISLGFQSLDTAVLRFLERAHDAGEAVDVFRQARAAGFTNINCDLIFAVPGLSTDRWRDVLGEVLALGPDHLSAYELTPEVGTRLGADVAAGLTTMPDDERKLEHYQVAESMLAGSGLRRYEVSNWSRPGSECRHNIAYWSGVPYAAAGAGAHAFLQPPAIPSWLGSPPEGAVSVRQWNVANPAAYVQAVRRDGHPVAGQEWLDLPTTISDAMMMGLRMDRGVDMGGLRRRWGRAVAGSIAAPVRKLAAAGLIAADGSRLSATASGQRLLNQVALEFLPD
jgi:oxygen-independent coproporphyrinogen-3 oxidase